MPRPCRTIRNWNNGSFSTLQLLPNSCLTPKLKASSIYICHVCCTANLLLGSLQVTIYLLSSLNLRKKDHSSLPGTIFKVCFSICVFDFFSLLSIPQMSVSRSVLSFLTDFGDRSSFARLHSWPDFYNLTGRVPHHFSSKELIYLKDQQGTKPNSAFCPSSQPSGDKCREPKSRIFTPVLHSCNILAHRPPPPPRWSIQRHTRAGIGQEHCFAIKQVWD